MSVRIPLGNLLLDAISSSSRLAVVLAQSMYRPVLVSVLDAIRGKWRKIRRRVSYVRDCCAGRSDFCLPWPGYRRLTIGQGDGAWVISENVLRQGCIVYSFGVVVDISFDLDMIARFGAVVHAFDPTPAAEAWIRQQSVPAGFQFHALGLSTFDGQEVFSLPSGHEVSYVKGTPAGSRNVCSCDVARWDTIARSIGHGVVDLVKMDIEGMEFEVLEEIARSDVRINQLLVEFHHRFHGLDGIVKTRKAVQILKKAGFHLFNISDRGTEYSFVRSGL